MAILTAGAGLQRRADDDDDEPMAEGDDSAGGRLGHARRPASPTDVTDTPPSSPAPEPEAPQAASPRAPFAPLPDEPDYDRLSDLDELNQSYLVFARDPPAVRRRAMAGDFSEGRLETFVGSPQKELAGTQNQYVSYLVTTKVGSPVCSCSLLVFMLRISDT